MVLPPLWRTRTCWRDSVPSTAAIRLRETPRHRQAWRAGEAHLPSARAGPELRRRTFRRDRHACRGRRKHRLRVLRITFRWPYGLHSTFRRSCLSDRRRVPGGGSRRAEDSAPSGHRPPGSVDAVPAAMPRPASSAAGRGRTARPPYRRRRTARHPAFRNAS